MKGFKKVKKPVKRAKAHIDVFTEHHEIMVQAAKDDLENQTITHTKEKERYEQKIEELTAEIFTLKTELTIKCEELTEAIANAEFWEKMYVNLLDRSAQ